MKLKSRNVLFLSVIVVVIISFSVFLLFFLETSIQPESPSQVEMSTSAEKSETSYSALTETYKNEQYHFSFLHPKELEIAKGSDIILSDSRNSKNYALKICTPDTTCGSYSAKVSSLNDFEKSLIFDDGLKQIPLENNKYKTANGITVLKQRYESKYFDVEGNDITHNTCEMCGESTRFILFKNPNDFIILWQITGDTNLTERIIDTIQY